MNKEHEVIEIIKTKGIDVDAIKYHKDVEHYNFSLGGKFEKLTQKEFDLLKEVLCSTENSFISKYIRTKDGTIELNREEIEREIVKQADTIEELCDEFVIKGTRGRYLSIPLQECELRNIPKTQIYGAIWTDKGLIYVAKLNDKGELELL